ncbi:MAG: ABC transporter permease subunit [Oscillospiraceae bacterium]|nr:ABC transporter permease subunit [Oscillospiraceae bacterium]
MSIVKHELRLGRLSLGIWAGGIGFLLAICVLIFPEMKDQMQTLTEAMSSMGALTTAFGMDRLNYGTLIGYYAIECGNILGLGGALYAALCAVSILSREERERTAEFLLTHPISRQKIVGEKLLAVFLQITALNGLIYLLSLASMAVTGEAIAWKELNLLHLAYYLCQLTLGGICFGLSAFLRKGSVGVGLGLAVLAYALNLIANITESAKFLKYFTPFGWCEGAEILEQGHLDSGKLAVGAAMALLGIGLAFWHYTKKDIHS